MGWLKRLFGRGNDSPAPAPVALDPVTEEDVAEAARERIVPGFLTLDEAVEHLLDYFSDSAGPVDEASIQAIATRVWEQRRAEERSWSGPGDHARLAAAYAGLEREGIVARMNFTCCQTCGHAEIEDERRGGERGYVFFHQQDSERLVEDDAALYLAYSYFDDHPALDRDLLDRAGASKDPDLRAAAKRHRDEVETSVGAEVVHALRDQGLQVAWDGTNGSRPTVAVREWRKPLPR